MRFGKFLVKETESPTLTITVRTIILGLDTATRLSGTRFRGPIVIPLISNLNEGEWSTFHEYLHELTDTGDWPMPRLRIVSSNDPSISDVIHNLSRGEILIMKVGSVPQEVWELLMNYSTLPPTVAGSSGSNFLRERGRPYFNTDHMELPEGLLPETQAEFRRACDAIVKPYRGADIESLGHTIIDSMDPQSNLSRAFLLQQHAQQTIADRVSTVLGWAGREIARRRRVVSKRFHIKT